MPEDTLNHYVLLESSLIWLAGTHQISEFSRDIAVYQVKLATFVCFQHSRSVGEGLNELQNKRR